MSSLLHCSLVLRVRNCELEDSASQEGYSQWRLSKLYAWSELSELKAEVERVSRIPRSEQRIFYRGSEMTRRAGSVTLSQFGIHSARQDSDEPVILVSRRRCSIDERMIEYGCLDSHSRCQSLIQGCLRGFDEGRRPELSRFGESATYFLSDDNGQRCAVFKPSDEEAGQPNNPRGRTECSLRNNGIKSGDNWKREVAAYLVSMRSDDFFDVPETTAVELLHRRLHFRHSKVPFAKVGSLQKYVSTEDAEAGGEGSCVEDFSHYEWSKHDTHKIGVLDIRVLNADRNSGNVLVKHDKHGVPKLIPVDHGLILPEKIEMVREDWCWMGWPKSKLPFQPETLRMIEQIDVEADIRALRELSISEVALNNMRIAVETLKTGARLGLTLFEIAGLFVRPSVAGTRPSRLEQFLSAARLLAQDQFKQHLLLERRRLGLKAMRPLSTAKAAKVSGTPVLSGRKETESGSIRIRVSRSRPESTDPSQSSRVLSRNRRAFGETRTPVMAAMTGHLSPFLRSCSEDLLESTPELTPISRALSGPKCRSLMLPSQRAPQFLTPPFCSSQEMSSALGSADGPLADFKLAGQFDVPKSSVSLTPPVSAHESSSADERILFETGLSKATARMDDSSVFRVSPPLSIDEPAPHLEGLTLVPAADTTLDSAAMLSLRDRSEDESSSSEERVIIEPAKSTDGGQHSLFSLMAAPLTRSRSTLSLRTVASKVRVSDSDSPSEREECGPIAEPSFSSRQSKDDSVVSYDRRSVYERRHARIPSGLTDRLGVYLEELAYGFESLDPLSDSVMKQLIRDNLAKMVTAHCEALINARSEHSDPESDRLFDDPTPQGLLVWRNETRKIFDETSWLQRRKADREEAERSRRMVVDRCSESGRMFAEDTRDVSEWMGSVDSGH